MAALLAFLLLFAGAVAAGGGLRSGGGEAARRSSATPAGSVPACMHASGVTCADSSTMTKPAGTAPQDKKERLAADCAGPVAGRTSRAEDGVGLLVVAHGGSPTWNGLVRQAFCRVSLPYPKELAFLMAMPAEAMGMEHGSPRDKDLDQAVADLERAGARTIVVVPLFVSTRSTPMSELRYRLRLDPEPPGDGTDMMGAILEPVVSRATFSLADAMDHHPRIAGILLDQARRLSRGPGRETVVLAAHGPTEEDEVTVLRSHMEALARSMEEEGGFARVVPAIFRMDNAGPVRDRAVADIRAAVTEAARDTRVLVVPYLVSRGDIDQWIGEQLRGLPVTMSETALADHPRLAEWIREAALARVSPLVDPASGGTRTLSPSSSGFENSKI